MAQLPLGFLIVFLLFSFLFISNSYKLWFKTEEYYKDLYASLTNEKIPLPFKGFFLKRLENKQSWLFWQKAFSLLGIVAVVGMDVLMVMAYLG